MKIKSAIKLFFLLLIASKAFGSEKDSLAVKYSETIKAGDLSKHLHIIASDEYEGRETGRSGQKKAAKYIADHFRAVGIQPLTNPVLKDYYQEYPLEIQYPYGAGITLNGKAYEFMKDFYFFPGFEDTQIQTNEILFLGYGISDENYDDYKAIDVKNKTLMVLNGEPHTNKGESYITKSNQPSQWSMSWRKKTELAAKKEASCLLIVVGNFEDRLKNMKHFIEQPSYKLKEKKKEKNKKIPCLYISEKMANDLLQADNEKNEIKKLIKKTDKNGQSKSIKINTNITININRKTEEATAENVLAYIEGAGQPDELVIITAHYDHIGVSEEKIYNGADDDGSGTVALLELAEAFAMAKKDGHSPKRSILIMPVSGEEKGLLGSGYYTGNPVFPLEKTVANLNIDMIGRLDSAHSDNPDYVYIIGSNILSSELHNISEEANKKYVNLQLDYTFNAKDDPNKFYYRSDHYNFAKNNIPVIFYFNGVHADYHKPTDTVDKINFDKMEKITRLVFFTAWELANRDRKIVVDGKNKEEDAK